MTWRLESGRRIQLRDVRLSATYGGLIEGYPTARLNDLMLAGLPERVAAMFPRSAVHVLEPERHRPADGFDGAFGPEELLPAVTCIGLFDSTPVDPSLDDVLNRSWLAVAWFQPDVAIPREQPPAALSALRWEAHAVDSEL